MKLSDFILFSEEEKKTAVLHRVILVAKRSNATHLFFLFRMDYFYVETSCHMDRKCVDGYQVFDHPALLQPYLEAIAIDDLLN